MFGREPKPGSRKAQARFQAFTDAQESKYHSVWMQSEKQRDAEWGSYQLDHPDVTSVFSPPDSMHYHPVYKQLDNEHRARMGEFHNAQTDVINNTWRKANGYTDPNRELFRTDAGDALRDTHKRVLNSQQFGQLPEYGENY